MNFFTQAFPPQLKDYYDSKISTLETHVFNDLNTTTTASNSITYNEYSGAITFEEIEIPQSSTVNITITNSMFAGRMPVFNIFNASTLAGSIEDIEILTEQISFSGTILLIPIKNNSVSDDVTLTFELLFTT